MPIWLGDKESACQCRRYRRRSSIPGSGRSPGEGKGNPLQYCCRDNPMDTGAQRAIVHGVTESEMTEQAGKQGGDSVSG